MGYKIAIGGDHAGFTYKSLLKQQLEAAGHDVTDFGPGSDASVDYPDHVHPLAKAVVNKEADFGILICGSGNGVAMTANKYQEIRAALCWQTELAKLSREHNNANILCIPARFVSQEVAADMTRVFLETEFEGGRHQNRVDKIPVC
ncbi:MULTISPECIES: ribose 5-phosphate isomerase B [Pontibacter]|uniref:Ribose 5-phosphate isomerase B n=1 Tax=Pontibacter lucknowensis TaxID=1077936 RepID=A0A1N6USZ3_9BACT|nr:MULTISPECIES: ribose 5-phosphate isomerase B [Pontibacter]EJF10498.1 ribose/galactose isomerase [Pontibacter sp. BAB1700]SIQ68707.1 ribose 5-phosphate isomerase B [Pontibacter lucknowensis]